MRTKVRGYLADYRKLLRGHVPQAQQVLRRLIVGKLTFTPKLMVSTILQDAERFVRCSLA